MSRVQVAVTRGPQRPCGVGDYAERLCAALPADFAVRWLELPERGTLRDFRDAAGAARGVDVVHVHYEYGLFEPVKPWRNRLATFLAALPAPAVVTLHGDLPTLRPRWAARASYGLLDGLRDTAYLPFFPGWERRVHARAHWIAQLETQARRAQLAAGAGRVSLEPHPVPRAKYRWRSDGAAAGTLVVPGFTKAHKGHAQLLEWIAARPALRLVVAGGPQDADDARTLRTIHERARALRVEDRVEVTGYLPDDAFQQALARAGVVVLPYAHGGASGALAMAIAVGAPIVASDLPAFRELHAAGAGIDFLPEGAAAGGWLEALCADPGRLEALAARNRAFAQGHGYESAALRLAALFRRLAARA